MKINQPKVSHQCIDGEVVVINLENGSYYSLLDLAARLWELIAAGWSRAELMELVAATYPDGQGSDATASFLDQLVSEGLVSEIEGTAKVPVSIALPETFAAPVLETFTDLQELLMLDPIHEVDAAGWPHKPADS
jgi:Coenzyme PQQ synthesis protein D (PqqD)